MKLRFYYLLPMLWLLQGCVSQAGSALYNTDFAASKNINCEGELQYVSLFFEDEEINFNYEVIGMVEVKGGPATKNEELLENLKARASEQCANAVIHLKKQYLTASKIDEDIFTKEKTTLVYSQPQFSGLAVRIEGFEDFIPVEILIAEPDGAKEKAPQKPVKWRWEALLLLLPIIALSAN